MVCEGLRLHIRLVSASRSTSEFGLVGLVFSSLMPEEQVHNVVQCVSLHVCSVCTAERGLAWARRYVHHSEFGDSLVKIFLSVNICPT